ncbi:acyl carrier protein [Pseudomonas capeferrum]|uniref:acyl carrier protein n=1 Tax=Pseudomonas capeferrum TaxID=1495066 RepID=UPI0015E36C95|nr:acyl carrier protein [Pseudomonas capeferrum]MBA1200197.1 acyl carrier protein [Pseudomonas capeferrum]
MLKRDVVIDYILECLRGLTAENQRPVGPQSNLIEDLGLESIKIMDLLMMLEDQFDLSIPINILIDVSTPAELADALMSHLEGHHGAV